VRFRYTADEYTTVSDAADRAPYTVSGYAAEVALASAGQRDDVRPAAGVDDELLIAPGRWSIARLVDLNAVPTKDPAEKQALADLLTRLEQEIDVPGVTQEQIDAAREEVSRNMSW
jgi:hypothetical protein